MKLLLLQPAQLPTYLVGKYPTDIAPISKVTPHNLIYEQCQLLPWAKGLGVCLWVKFFPHPLSESPQRQTLKYSG